MTIDDGRGRGVRGTSGRGDDLPFLDLNRPVADAHLEAACDDAEELAASLVRVHHEVALDTPVNGWRSRTAAARRKAQITWR